VSGAGGNIVVPELVTFHVPGIPVGKQRPRISTRGGFVRSFTPPKTVSYEGLVSLAAERSMAGRDLLTGPVAMSLKITLPIAQSWSLKKKNAALRGEIRPTGRPDLDNIAKAISDACNGIVYGDDSQVVLLTASKHYAEIPGVFVQVENVQ
jgi:Holliday junction resolvase RusA-like endonuclease